MRNVMNTLVTRTSSARPVYLLADVADNRNLITSQQIIIMSNIFSVGLINLKSYVVLLYTLHALHDAHRHLFSVVNQEKAKSNILSK